MIAPHDVSSPDIGIVGGGLLGLTIAYRLAGQGVPVTVYEAGDRLGGLAGTTDLGGRRIDRYYHVVLPTDTNVRELAAELGLGDRFRFRRTGVGFYQDGRLCSMSSAVDLARFPGLRADDRARLASFVARCRLKGDYADLEDVSIEDWICRFSSRRLWDRLWRPLLDSKFDGAFDDLPATYLWSRTRRTAGSRDRGAREVMGWLEGGYQTLVDALAEAIERRGGAVRTSTRVRAIPSSGGRALGVVLDEGLVRHDAVITTMLRPSLDVLLSDELAAALGPDPNRYLGVVCLVARVRRSVSPYYALNITDRRVPLTSVVETTHVVDPEHAGGTLLYVPKYVRPESPELDRPSKEIRGEYLAHVRRIFPDLRREDVIATQVARATVAEPIHRVGVSRTLELFPAPGLVTPSSAHVYPDIVHGHAIIGLAGSVAAQVSKRVSSAAARELAA